MIDQGTDDYAAAVREFGRANNLDPTSDEAIRGLASALAKLGKPRQAEVAYQHAIALRPNYWAGYGMLGVFYYQAGRYGDAERMFRQVTALSPDNYRGPSNIGGLYLLQGRYADAIPLLKRAVFLWPTSDAYLNLGSAYFFLHNFEEAAKTYRQALAVNQLDYLVWGNLAEATSRIKGMRMDALELYKKAISLAEQQLHITPRDSTLLGNLALYYSMAGEKEKALGYVKRALAEDGNDPEVRLNAAEVFIHCGNVSEALRWLSAAVAAGYSPILARDTPSFDELKGDPRFQRAIK